MNGATLRMDYLSHVSTSDLLALASNGLISLINGNVLFDGTVIGAMSGGDAGSALLVTLNSSATLLMVETLLDNVYFRNTSQAPLTNARLMVAGLQIVGGSYTEITASLSVIAVEDPALLADDGMATLESASVVIDVLANDIDPDTDLTVGMINGLVTASGGTVTITSGARVTLTMQGQLLYDANGAFDALADPASGTSYTSATDYFTYSVTNGETALVEILITGQTSADDILRGDGGTNSIHATLAGQTLQGLVGIDSLYDSGLAVHLSGGEDDYRYYVESATTTLMELTGQGLDTVFTDLKRFTLLSEIENLNFSGTNGRFYGNGNASNNIIEGGNLGDFLIGYQFCEAVRVMMC